MDAALSAVFVGHDTVDGHTEYLIRVSDGRSTWHIRRRYRSFRDLHDALSQHFADLPSIPPKKFIGNLNPEFVQRRQGELQSYIESLLRRSEVARSKDTRAFLEASHAVRAISSGHQDESRGQQRVLDSAKENNKAADQVQSAMLASLAEIVDKTAHKFIDLSATPSPLEDEEIRRRRDVYKNKFASQLRAEVNGSLYALPRCSTADDQVLALLSAPSIKGKDDERQLTEGLGLLTVALSSVSVSGAGADRMVVILPSPTKPIA
eukprot:GILK01001666.1.p1 GENE.GILK01001666.1~~GILK01001666.1.p1  ORF type:complete len:280 (+),score=35.87 GILK01001666.1:51-842(+)